MSEDKSGAGANPAPLPGGNPATPGAAPKPLAESEAEALLLAELEEMLQPHPPGSGLQWAQAVHCALISNVCKTLAAKGRLKPGDSSLLVVLGLHGLGGNASQFGQWLALAEPKGYGRPDLRPKKGEVSVAVK